MEHILSLSYGKDSIATLGAIEMLKLPLTKIIHAEVWATDAIPADLPPMVEFKQAADEIIKRRFGIEVEHVWATDKDGSKLTFEKQFYRLINSRIHANKRIYGFPMIKGAWCNSKLKMAAIDKAKKKYPECESYIGVASDELKRIQRHQDKAVMPLVMAGWDEQYCFKWAKDNALISPIYNSSARGGCWFCHFQGTEQLRLLRKNYPEYWELLMRWSDDSPVSFKPGRTVRDYDARFRMEELGLINTRVFRWGDVNASQMNIFDFLEGEEE